MSIYLHRSVVDNNTNLLLLMNSDNEVKPNRIYRDRKISSRKPKYLTKNELCKMCPSPVTDDEAVGACAQAGPQIERLNG